MTFFGQKLSIPYIMATHPSSALEKCTEENYAARRGHPKLSDVNKVERRVKQVELSEAQKRMLVLQNSVPESSAYTETIALNTDATTDADLILKELVRHHPILLASYDPARKVLSISHENVSAVMQPLSKVRSLSSLKEYIHKHIPAFNMSDGLLSQMKVITCGKTKVFVIYIHHILADDVTLQNLKTTLKLLLQNQPPDVQFDKEDLFLCSSVIDSEKEYMMSEEYATDKCFWEREFEECPDSSSLSFRNLADISGFEVYTTSTEDYVLHARSQQEIERFCKLHRLTKFQVFLALFVLVLQRYLGSQEVLVLVPVSTRDDQTMKADGLFVNMVLFRYTINLNDTLEQHILNVAQKWLTVVSHSRYPLNKISELIWSKSGKHLACLCSVMFAYTELGIGENELRIPTKHAKMELFIEISENTTGCKMQCEHSDMLIDKGVSRRFVRTLVEVCNNFNIRSEQNSLRYTEFLTDEEIKLQEEFTETETIDYASESVYEMFVRNTNSTPSKTAVVHRGQKFTYGNIMDLSDEIAAKISNCVDSNSVDSLPILLIMEKNEIAIAAMFAVWKLGGFFMPISVLHAPSITEAIENAKPCLILINEDRFEKYVQNSKCKIVCLKHTSDLPAAKFQSKKHVFVQELEKPAYLIQTSGSTGKPKQIKISQMSLSILAVAWAKVFKLRKTEVNVLQWATLSFDVFIGDVVRGMCCTSGKVCICPEDCRLEIHYIKELINKEHITFADLTPQFALTLAETSNMEDLQSLDILVIGSDVLETEVYRKVQSCLQRGQRLINCYGMSEATIDSSYFEGENLPITRGGTVPIGKPFPGVRMKVLETETLRPCPVGTIGELYIGGHVLGSGDTDIVTVKSGEMLLKTNDRACWLPSGDLELFGRLDSVCKLRGFRISTTEIENTILTACSFVREVSVTVLKSERDGSKTEFLCAYVVLETHQELTDIGKHKIKHSVQARHPYYMVPSLITAVEEIPLTANGKVNRAALPSILDVLHSSNINKNIETSETVHTLRQLFAETIGIDSSLVDIRHTFFEQGANSLLLVQFHSLVKRKTDYDVTIADMFSYPSLESLGDYLDFLNDTHEERNQKTKCT